MTKLEQLDKKVRGRRRIMPNNSEEETTFRWSFASKLKDIREGLDLTQVEMADRLGIPQSYISRYESAAVRIPSFIIHLLHTKLSVNPNWLFDLDDSMTIEE